MQHRPLILASASPRRAELLGQIGVEFSINPVDLDEAALQGEEPVQQVLRLACEKAKAAKSVLAEHESAVVIASDTLIALDHEALGKPKNKPHGIEMLKRLSGRSHQVITAVSVLDLKHIKTIAVTTTVNFAALSVSQINDYWETGEPADKAGGYGIQGIGGQFVPSIEGSYSAVVGLPLYETVQLLKEFEVIA